MTTSSKKKIKWNRENVGKSVDSCTATRRLEWVGNNCENCTDKWDAAPFQMTCKSTNKSTCKSTRQLWELESQRVAKASHWASALAGGDLSSPPHWHILHLIYHLAASSSSTTPLAADATTTLLIPSLLISLSSRPLTPSWPAPHLSHHHSIIIKQSQTIRRDPQTFRRRRQMSKIPSMDRFKFRVRGESQNTRKYSNESIQITIQRIHNNRSKKLPSIAKEFRE